MKGRRIIELAVVTAVGILVAVILIVPGRGQSQAPSTGTEPSQGTDPSSQIPPPTAKYSGVLVPTTGAYLGAYVQPTDYTQQGEITAFQSFEQQVGRPIEMVHVYNSFNGAFPTREDKFFVDRGKILLLTWGGNPNTQAIIAGRDDAMIRARAEAVKALGHPILLEFRHEMDRPNLQWTIHGPADYIAAWDHIRSIFRAVGANNVGWVWCPTALGFTMDRAQAFYPGNNEVDWVCADLYVSSPAESLDTVGKPFLAWAAHHDKPVIIGEFAVGGDSSGWAGWLAQAGRFAESDRQIKAMAYFDAEGVNASNIAFHYLLSKQPTAISAFSSLLAQPYFQAVPPNDP